LPHRLGADVGPHGHGKKNEPDDPGFEKKVGAKGRGPKAVVGRVVHFKEGHLDLADPEVEQRADAGLGPGTEPPAEGVHEAKGVAAHEADGADSALPHDVVEEVFVAFAIEDVVDELQRARQVVGLAVPAQGQDEGHGDGEHGLPGFAPVLVRNHIDGHDDEARERPHDDDVVNRHGSRQNQAFGRFLVDVEQQDGVGKVVVDAKSMVGRLGVEAAAAPPVVPGGRHPAVDEEVHGAHQESGKNREVLHQAHGHVKGKHEPKGAVEVLDFVVAHGEDGEEDDGRVDQGHERAQANHEDSARGDVVAEAQDQVGREDDVGQAGP